MCEDRLLVLTEVQEFEKGLRSQSRRVLKLILDDIARTKGEGYAGYVGREPTIPLQGQSLSYLPEEDYKMEVHVASNKQDLLDHGSVFTALSSISLAVSKFEHSLQF